MQIPTDFITLDYLLTFAGMVMAIVLIVQFSKIVFALDWPERKVQAYAFIWALLFVLVSAWIKGINVTAQGIATLALLCLINAIVVTLAAMGAYDAINKPTAKSDSTAD